MRNLKQSILAVLDEYTITVIAFIAFYCFSKYALSNELLILALIIERFH